ncbi:hypothetical protein KSP40_PGU001125 [Platanthera guangdongensis]|uniref:Uncharacterized protein n=1 Tax=Platanthera guangdongensis TaxID=2320717 RepID=A0ABR2LFR8_9ASPA
MPEASSASSRWCDVGVLSIFPSTLPVTPDVVAPHFPVNLRPAPQHPTTLPLPFPISYVLSPLPCSTCSLQAVGLPVPSANPVVCKPSTSHFPAPTPSVPTSASIIHLLLHRNSLLLPFPVSPQIPLLSLSLAPVGGTYFHRSSGYDRMNWIGENKSPQPAPKSIGYVSKEQP